MITLPNAKRTFVKHWGLFYFGLLSLISFLQLLRPATRGHYHVFTSAARALWNHEPTYFTDFGWQTGLNWFYSPSCALLFYLPFSFLPETLGILLSTGLMSAAFVYSVFFLCNQFSPSELPANLFWFFIGSEMIGAVTSQKTEILIAALCMIACGLLLKRRPWLAGVLLALVTNWKFQPLPLVGLLVLTEIFYRRDFRFLVSFLGSSVAFLVTPFLVLDSVFVFETYRQWMLAVQDQLLTQWTNFDHVYNLLRKGLGIEISYRQTQLIAGVTGLGFAAWLINWMHLDRSRSRHTEAVLIAVSCATVFMVSFSPLSQSNGYVLIAPLLLAAVVLFGRSEPHSMNRKVLKLTLSFGWLFTSLLTSDLVPKIARNFARANAVKSLGPLILLLGVLYVLRPLNSTPRESK